MKLRLPCRCSQQQKVYMAMAPAPAFPQWNNPSFMVMGSATEPQHHIPQLDSTFSRIWVENIGLQLRKHPSMTHSNQTMVTVVNLFPVTPVWSWLAHNSCFKTVQFSGDTPSIYWIITINTFCLVKFFNFLLYFWTSYSVTRISSTTTSCKLNHQLTTPIFQYFPQSTFFIKVQQRNTKNLILL